MGTVYGVPAWSMSEVTLQNAIRGLCEERGLAVQHITDAKRTWLPGWPDLVIIGRAGPLGESGVLYAELKKEGEELDPAQRQVRHRLIAAGQPYRIWTPKDLLRGTIAAELDSLR